MKKLRRKLLKFISHLNSGLLWSIQGGENSSGGCWHGCGEQSDSDKCLGLPVMDGKMVNWCLGWQTRWHDGNGKLEYGGGGRISGRAAGKIRSSMVK